MNAQTICFSGRLSVWAWRRQLSEWPRFEWWSTQPLFRSAEALWALARPAHATLLRNKTGDGFCCYPTSHHQVASKTQSEQEDWLGESLKKLTEWREWMIGKENEGMDRGNVVKELKRKEGVWPVCAMCLWMGIWGIVYRPICSSVGEVVKSQSQGWGPEGQERGESNQQGWGYCRGVETWKDRKLVLSHQNKMLASYFSRIYIYVYIISKFFSQKKPNVTPTSSHRYDSFERQFLLIEPWWFCYPNLI